MLSVFVFIFLISFLVFVHELGHFIVAKRLGVRVEEFGIGLPPRIIGRKFGETIYSINLLPFGGFVRLTGEDAFETSDAVDAQSDQNNFMSKSPTKRLMILVAGVVMNFILALILYQAFFAINGYKSLSIPLIFDYNFRFGDKRFVNTVVANIQPESPAEGVGIKVGEAIIEINGTPVYNHREVRSALQESGGEAVRLLLMDVGKMTKDVRSLTVVPGLDDEGKEILGVLLSKAVILDYSADKGFAGAAHAYNMLGYSVNVFSRLIGLTVSSKDLSPISQSVAGPIGIFGVVDSIMGYASGEIFLRLLDLGALLSLTLAFINILPFPALDGGRMIFVLVELVSGKRVSPKFEAKVHRWGMILLLGLLFFVTFKDIRNII
ncbi:site-2 protease family protein [candidate division WWE3 bacterium]|nr:site-2 protease family protein [candidate division WWE3 bacterium]